MTMHPLPAPVSIGTLLRTVSEVFGISVARIISAQRTTDVCCARYAFFGVALRDLARSSTQAARACGDRDHSTAIGSARRFDELMADPQQIEFQTHVALVRQVMELCRQREIENAVWTIDTVQVARRILADPARGVTSASALELRALALRLLELENIAKEEPHEENQ